VNDAIDRLLAERQQLEHGLPATLALSVSAHFVLAATVLIGPLLLPREPALRVADGFAVVLPRGGGGSPAAVAPPAEAPAPQPEPAVSQAPPAPPAVLKPPPKVEPRPRALPLPDARAVKRPPSPPPLPATERPAATKAGPAPAGAPAGRGASAATPGLEFGPPGPGIPTGTDSGGDWYLAGVQQKIWMTWNQQIKAGYTQSVGVTFTILPDGNVTGIRVTQPSGASLLDMAAQRAILNAAPFGPLPREYGQNPKTIQALFKPTS
jgi:protein TonB